MPEPTTTEELRDWHARREGWTKTTPEEDAAVGNTAPSWWKWTDSPLGRELKSRTWCTHPIAPTIDAAIRAMPEGWTWERVNDKLIGYGPKPPEVEVYITGHTPEAIRRDLLALARLAWIAEGATP